MENSDLHSNFKIDDDKIYCNSCTYLNNNTLTNCEMCGNSISSEEVTNNISENPSISSSDNSDINTESSNDSSDLINGLNISLMNINNIIEYFKMAGIYHIYDKSILKKDRIEYIVTAMPHIILIKINSCKVLSDQEKQILLSAFMYYKGLIQFKDEVKKLQLENNRNLTRMQDLEYEISSSLDKKNTPEFKSNKKQKNSKDDHSEVDVETIKEKREKIAAMYEKKFSRK